MNIKKNILEISSKLRYFYSKCCTFFWKDGDYFVDFPVVHYSLRPDCSSTYLDEKNNFGEEIAKQWSRDGCGIASMKIAVVSILRISNQSYSLPNISNLAEKLKSEGAYLDKIGWIHKHLVGFAIKNNLKSNNYVFENHLTICKEIVSNKLAVASVTLFFRGEQSIKEKNGTSRVLGKGGHLVIIKGFKWKNRKCEGFYVDDPQNKKLKDEAISDEFVPIKLFLKSYSEKVMYYWK